MVYFLDSGPKFTALRSPNAGGIVLDHMSFRFVSFQRYSEVGSCTKPLQILHDFGPKVFQGKADGARRYCGEFNKKNLQ